MNGPRTGQRVGFQLIWKITLLVHQGVIVCVRKHPRCCGATRGALCGHFWPMGAKDRWIQTRSRKPYAQQKVEDQNREKAPEHGGGVIGTPLAPDSGSHMQP